MARREDMAILDRPVDDTLGEQSDNGAYAASESGTESGGAGQSTGRRTKRNPDDLADGDMISLNVRVPNGLRKLLAGTAVEQETSVTQLVAQMLAGAYSYELPKTTRAPRTKKYANKEERIAAQKAAQQKNRQITRAILAAVEEGKLDVDIEALLADMAAKQAASGE